MKNSLATIAFLSALSLSGCNTPPESVQKQAINQDSSDSGLTFKEGIDKHIWKDGDTIIREIHKIHGTEITTYDSTNTPEIILLPTPNIEMSADKKNGLIEITIRTNEDIWITLTNENSCLQIQNQASIKESEISFNIIETK